MVDLQDQDWAPLLRIDGKLVPYLKLSKDTSDAVISVGQNITYTIKVENYSDIIKNTMTRMVSLSLNVQPRAACSYIFQ